MHCPVQTDNPEVLLDYCSRKLQEDLVSVVEQHIRGCTDCREFAEAQQQIWSALDAWTAEEVSSDFDGRLYARVETRANQGFWARVAGDRFTWKPALPFAAAGATAILAVLLVYPPSTIQSPDPVQPSLRVESLEPEQVERTLEDIEMLRQLTAPASSPSTRSL